MDSPYQDGLTFEECLSVKYTRRTSCLLDKIITTTFGVCTKYIAWVIGLSRNPGTPTGQQLACGGLAGFPERTSSLRLRTTSLAQGWRIGFVRSASCSLGCLPVTRNSSFETYGRSGSCCTGPGPLCG